MGEKRDQRQGPKDFPATSWTLILEVQQSGPRAEEALRELAGRYHGPVRAYLRAYLAKNFGDPEPADNLTQAFFDRILEVAKIFKSADRARGQFRNYLKRSVVHFAIESYRKLQPERARRVGLAEEGEGVVLGDSWNAERDFHREWVRLILQQADDRVREICTEKNQMMHYGFFCAHYLGDPDRDPSWEKLGREEGIDGKAARNRAAVVASHFRIVLRELLGNAADEEIATLLALF